MASMEFPSALFPGRPALELRVPDGWQAVPAVSELEGAALAALRPLPEEEFKANVVVTLDEVVPEHSVRTDLDAVAASAAARPQGATGEVYARTIGGVTFFGRDLSFVDPVAGTLLSSSLFGFLRREVDGGLVRITVTGTIGAARHREDYATLHGVIDGLRVTPAEGTTPLVDHALAVTGGEDRP
ncbi:hypothetical protein ACFQU3_12460 [Terrabacter sp. GCM10028922]|uniref:hypothetical protein n=1 Tax=Terrabacter sp. GCM10028922 TaxID=3273428 RepID=UPI00361D34B3